MCYTWQEKNGSDTQWWLTDKGWTLTRALKSKRMSTFRILTYTDKLVPTCSNEAFPPVRRFSLVFPSFPQVCSVHISCLFSGGKWLVNHPSSPGTLVTKTRREIFSSSWAMWTGRNPYWRPDVRRRHWVSCMQNEGVEQESSFIHQTLVKCSRCAWEVEGAMLNSQYSSFQNQSTML